MVITNFRTNTLFENPDFSEEQIKTIAIVDEEAEKLIKAYMPGPITLILKKKENLPDYVTNGKETIAVRMATSRAIDLASCPSLA